MKPGEGDVAKQSAERRDEAPKPSGGRHEAGRGRTQPSVRTKQTNPEPNRACDASDAQQPPPPQARHLKGPKTPHRKPKKSPGRNRPKNNVTNATPENQPPPRGTPPRRVRTQTHRGGHGGLGPPIQQRPTRPALSAGTDRPSVVGEEGVEPSRPCGHTDLNRARLPFRHSPRSGVRRTLHGAESGLHIALSLGPEPDTIDRGAHDTTAVGRRDPWASGSG